MMREWQRLVGDRNGPGERWDEEKKGDSSDWRCR